MEDLVPGAEAAAPLPPFIPQPLNSPTPADATTLPVGADRLRTLGPWFHTAGIVLLLLLYAFVSHLTHHTGDAGPHAQQTVTDATRAIAEAPKIPLYASTIMLSWLLLSAVVAGLYHRRAFFRNTLRRRFKSLWVDPALGLAIYLSFLTLVSILVLLFTASLMVSARHAQHRADHSTTGSSATAGNTDPAQQVQAAQQRVQRLLHVNREAVAVLAPHSVPELLLWICLSFTAGFCEEHLFRGYLLTQAMVAMRRFAMPSWFVSTLSVLLTSALFGSLHLYEGVGGAVIVGLLGGVFAVMTLVLGNLRAVIVAHFLQDLLGGLVYFIAHLRHAS